MTPLRAGSALIAGVVLAVLLGLQWVSARRHDLTWSRTGEWRHDLSLYAALLLVSLLVGSAAATRFASQRRSAGAVWPAALVAGGQDALIMAAQVGACVSGVFIVSLVAAPLAVAEQGGAVLVVAAALTFAAIFARSQAWILCSAALALALSGTWGSLLHDAVEPSREPLIVAPTYAGELYPAGAAIPSDPAAPPDAQTPELRRGDAPVLIDLRRLKMRGGPNATLRVRARSDLDRVIVALPPGVCAALRVDFRLADRRLPEAHLAAARAIGIALESTDARGGVAPANSGNYGVRMGDPARTMAGTNIGTTTADFGLLAYGEVIAGAQGVWKREASDPRRAINIELDVVAGVQIVVRDYPVEYDLGGALRSVRAERSPVEDAEMLRWPTVARTPERGPMVYNARSIRSPEAAQQQARRLAGPCATDHELARRWVLVTSSEESAGRLGSRTWVNGLGARRQVDEVLR